MAVARDSSANANHGHYERLSTPPLTWAAGLLSGGPNAAFDAEASDAKIVAPPGGISLAVNFSITFLFAFAASTSSGATGEVWYLNDTIGSQSLTFEITRNGAFGLAGFTKSTTVYPNNASTHLIGFTWNAATGVGTYYLDGTAVGTDTVGVLTNVFNEFVILRTGGPTGVLDEFATYPSLLSGGNMSTLNGARSSFSAFNTSVLSFSPRHYFHLDDRLRQSGGWYIGQSVMGPRAARLTDSSGNGHDGTYGTAGDAHGIMFQTAPLITGDTAVTITGGSGIAVGEIPLDPAQFSGDFTILGWLSPGGIISAEGFNAFDLNGNVVRFSINSGTAFTFTRTYDATHFDTFGVGGTAAAGQVGVTYRASDGHIVFYNNGAVFSSSTPGANAMTRTATRGRIGPVTAVGSYTFDEWALFPIALSSAQVSTIYAARTSFAGYDAAVLALTPSGYYHLNDADPFS